ncbi:hypothetical protein T492DRAFT_1082605 [Pavlovales sp. CCMP2436]|nr:hypothetical protein T492DRAFT_1082605 [Pavlovales sp. CCMP2436]
MLGAEDVKVVGWIYTWALERNLPNVVDALCADLPGIDGELIETCSDDPEGLRERKHHFAILGLKLEDFANANMDEHLTAIGFIRELSADEVDLEELEVAVRTEHVLKVLRARAPDDGTIDWGLAARAFKDAFPGPDDLRRQEGAQGAACSLRETALVVQRRRKLKSLLDAAAKKQLLEVDAFLDDHTIAAAFQLFQRDGEHATRAWRARKPPAQLELLVRHLNDDASIRAQNAHAAVATSASASAAKRVAGCLLAQPRVGVESPASDWAPSSAGPTARSPAHPPARSPAASQQPTAAGKRPAEAADAQQAKRGPTRAAPGRSQARASPSHVKLACTSEPHGDSIDEVLSPGTGGWGEGGRGEQLALYEHGSKPEGAVRPLRLLPSGRAGAPGVGVQVRPLAVPSLPQGQRRKRFTPDEEAAICEGYVEFRGSSHMWKEIKARAGRRLQDRSAVDVKDKVRNMIKAGSLTE